MALVWATCEYRRWLHPFFSEYPPSLRIPLLKSWRRSFCGSIGRPAVSSRGFPSCPSQKILNYPTLHSQSFKVILKDYFWSIFDISLLQLVKVDDDLFVEALVSQLWLSEVAPAFLHTRSSLTPPRHTRATLTPCSTSCCHAGLFAAIAQSGDGREAALSVGISASPSSCLGRNWTQGLCQVSNDFFSHPQIFGSPKNSIIAENCLPGNDSTEWDVNADGDPSIQVDSSLLHLFYLIVQFLFRVLLQDSV